VDLFRIDLAEEPRLYGKQIDSQDFLGCLFYSSPDTEYFFILTRLKFGDKTLKNYDIISGKTSTDKGKNTCKKQVCNHQQISWL